ncbi:hypothetical protein KAFR_0D01800 [Kazachstania africana CBS 2517]|uniref:Transcription initiation factor IIF subunit alpha n=1 Tax=Kazachstania africana (strain ATCC 22294 / BCRC 22015 / CBS 2517 / CECT 1963 / NBRC 1671 / NRRL Y-8276) TaxID=1071382 RepID=H2ATX7_KAZAF|nr:hypothetical protein KAFR_0D01800 [Kazachstania africana CBS 2517]CCF57827.1 hypothetical protein KAFR_0D01800 [Kazachstania africana CBS 2517]
MSAPRRNAINRPNGIGGQPASAGGGSGINHISPFIKRDRYKRNFLRTRQNGKTGNGVSVKKEDPDLIEAREKQLLGVESSTGAAKVKREKEEEFNEFPLRAIEKEQLENMRTHLLKFQSKKKLVPSESFHLPVRLHRKDTRNLQFQLTRAEIVQRQKEISEYKKKQEQEKLGVPGVATPATTTSVTAATTAPPQPNLLTPSTAASTATTTPNVDANSISDGATTSATPAPTSDNATPIVTKLEEAGISEHPEKVGLVKYDGKEDNELLGYEPGTTDPLYDVAPDGGGRARRGNSKRKTRQLKVLDENAKKLRFEEFYPWVMEDFDGYNTWVGSYEAGNSDSYVLLSVEDDGSFTMIPADKVYKFTARNKYATLTIEEAEKRMDRKSGEVPRWLMKHLDNIGTTTTRYDRTKRRLKTVADQRGVGGDEEEHDDNSENELDYDEEFADDEEAPIIDGNEQENKESEQRIKKEMLQANVLGLRDDKEFPEEDEDDLFNEKKIDEEGERIKKALQKTELAALYSSDDELNPYLSESDIEHSEEGKNKVKKENSEEKEREKSPSKKTTIKKENSPSVRNLAPQLRVKSIKDCIIVLKGTKKILKTFPEGEWNPEQSKKRQRDIDATDRNTNTTVKVEIKQEDEISPAKEISQENTKTSIPIITEQDIIDAVGDGKVNVKEFGKAIRRSYPGPENKKLMFQLVKKLCRKVDHEHMELKN